MHMLELELNWEIKSDWEWEKEEEGSAKVVWTSVADAVSSTITIYL